MGIVRATLIGLSLLLLPALPARAEDPDILAPFRFRDPAKELTPVERQRAIVYRSELDNQQRNLEQDELRGQLDPLDRRRLSDTRGELGRMNNVLMPPPATGVGASGGHTLPSLSGGSLVPAR
jgi:hypothetical protein